MGSKIYCINSLQWREKYFFILSVLILFFCNNSYSAGQIVISDKQDEFQIPSSKFEILEDKTGKLGFPEVSSDVIRKKFISSKSSLPTSVNTWYWIKFSIINNATIDNNWILQLPLHSDEIALYALCPDGKLKTFNTGQHMNFDSRPIDVRTIAFELPDYNAPVELYVRIFSKKHTDLSFIISKEKRYMEVHTKGYLFLGLIYGILILMAFYNFILFISIKEKIYIYYVLYTLSSIFFISWKDGLGFQFLWPGFPVVNQYHYSLGLFLLLITFLLFANDFLEIKKNHPKLYKVTYLIIAINLVFFIINVSDISYFDPLPYTYILSYFYFLCITIYYIKQGYKPARYLLISLVCMVTALTVIKLRYQGVLGWNWFIEYIFNYAIVVEVITMAIASRDKIAFLRIEKEKAREAQLIEAKLKAENELIVLRNQTLEGELIYRNNELAVMAANLTQKNEFYNHIKIELKEIANELPANSVLKKIIKKIENESDFDNNWEQFQLSFDKVHQNFLSGLRNKHPQLKPADLLLCAYVKMGKSNKEIASLLNITISGVEKKRQRVKEKLRLESENKLSDYILHFK